MALRVFDGSLWCSEPSRGSLREKRRSEPSWLLRGKKLVCWRGTFEWIQAMVEVVGFRGGDLVAVGVLGSMRFG